MKSHFTFVWIGTLLLFAVPGAAQSPGSSKTTGTASRGLSTTQPAYVPLTNKQRWHTYLADLASPTSVVLCAAGAGVNQWGNTPSEWHQDAEGYGRRFANSFGAHLVRGSIRSGAGALLDEDTRYVPSGESRFGPRLKYALTSTFMGRSHTGERRIAFSTIGAFAGTSFISRAWQPPSTSQPADAMSNFGISVGVATGVNLLHEFFPRAYRLWGLRHD